MHQRAYSHLTDGTQALIVQFVKEPENDELLLKAFNEVASNNALNAKEVKNLAIDEFRKEIQHLATKDELNGLRYELIATKEALQAQIDGLKIETSSIRNEMTAIRNELKAEIKASSANLIKWVVGIQFTTLTIILYVLFRFFGNQG